MTTNKNILGPTKLAIEQVTLLTAIYDEAVLNGEIDPTDPTFREFVWEVELEMSN